MTDNLLGPDEPSPVGVENENGPSPIVVVCEHAGRRIPAKLGTLGLDPEHLAKHFMWDPGALPVAQALAHRLGAVLIHQRYSRMVCDCNRPVHVPDLSPTHGEGIKVPGNTNLSDEDREARVNAIWRPFHNRIANILDARGDRPTALLTIHTFTPVFFGVPRPYPAGVLFHQDKTFAPTLRTALAEALGADVRANEPYTITRDGDVTIPVHGEERGLPCALIELRNDLVATPHAVADYARAIDAATRTALAAVGIKEDRAA